MRLNFESVEHRKRRKSHNTPHHAHALTFSVYRRRPYLSLPGVAEAFLLRLDAARRRHRFEIWAYCVMPDHVHVVIHPSEEVYSMATILKAIKSPSAMDFFEQHPELREEFRAGPNEFRFWQAGGGYDRNLFTARATWAEIRYVHNNPVRKGLCESFLEWPWSSAPAYHGEATTIPVDVCLWSTE